VWEQEYQEIQAMVKAADSNEHRLEDDADIAWLESLSEEERSAILSAKEKKYGTIY